MSDKKYEGSAIIRTQHNKDFFVMNRLTAQDENLSFEARGMIGYLLSKPDSWDIRVHDLAQKCTKGRVYRILDELASHGYLKKRTKYKDEKGRWQWTPYILSERPYIGFPDTEKPDTENDEIKEVNRDIENSDEVEEKKPPHKETNNNTIATDFDIMVMVEAWGSETDMTLSSGKLHMNKKYRDVGIKLVEDLGATVDEVKECTKWKVTKKRIGAYLFWYLLDDIPEYREKVKQDAIQLEKDNALENANQRALDIQSAMKAEQQAMGNN